MNASKAVTLVERSAAAQASAASLSRAGAAFGGSTVPAAAPK
jgi:hypothetical protein